MANVDALTILLMLFFHLPKAIAKAGLLPVHGPKLFQHAALRIVEALHNCSQNMHVIAQAGNFGSQPLQQTDISQIDNRLAALVAQPMISFPNDATYLAPGQITRECAR
jgi:hypothetical protein